MVFMYSVVAPVPSLRYFCLKVCFGGIKWLLFDRIYGEDMDRSTFDLPVSSVMIFIRNMLYQWQLLFFK